VRSTYITEECAQSSDRSVLKAPRAAAVAGIIFSILTMLGFSLVRYAIPVGLTASNRLLSDSWRRDALLLALDFVPFAGIAFVWFIAVLRDFIGDSDQFFAIVLVSSGLLFTSSLFGAAAVTGSILESVGSGNIDNETYFFGRCLSDALLNLFAMKMAGVFIFSTSGIGLRTAIFPRWIAYTGYACGLLLLIIIANWRWITLLFPTWILVLSASLLRKQFDSRLERPRPATSQ
jgi:hypothetical protein